MTLHIRQLRLRCETSVGPYGADYVFKSGLNILWADNTRGKSTSLQGLIYALGLEKMLSPKREIPLTYAMTTHLEDPSIARKPLVLESYVAVEIQNSKNEVITVYRAVKSKTDMKLVSVYYGPNLTSPNKEYTKRDYFVRDPGAAQREAGFHNFLAKFLGWELPEVRRYEGKDALLYLETIFPLFYVEQKRGWSSIPASFPTYMKIRDVGLRAVEFILGLQTHELALKRQKLNSELSDMKIRWRNKHAELIRAAHNANARLKNLPSMPTSVSNHIDAAFMQVIDQGNWQSANDLTKTIRQKITELTEKIIPTVKDVSTETARELNQLINKHDQKNAQRNALFKIRSSRRAQLNSLDKRLASLSEDLQKNTDALKLKKLGSRLSEIVSREQCPTCDQEIEDVLLPQGTRAAVMSVGDNIEFIKSQKNIFLQVREETQKSIEDADLKLSAATSDVMNLSARLRALRAETISPSQVPSVKTIEEKMKLEMRLQNLMQTQEAFELGKLALVEYSYEYARILGSLEKLPKDHLPFGDKEKLRRLARVVQSQAKQYGFTTFSPEEIEISEQNYRPQKEGFDIGFQLSASDAIRLKWAYQIGLLEIARNEKTNHPGLVIFDEPRQQEPSSISFAKLLKQASKSKQHNQQVIFSSSKNRAQLATDLEGVDCNLIEFENYVLQRL